MQNLPDEVLHERVGMWARRAEPIRRSGQGPGKICDTRSAQASKYHSHTHPKNW